MSTTIPHDLVKRAEDGDARAQYRLAAMLAGAGRRLEADRWLERAAAGGEPEAYFTLGTRRLQTKAGLGEAARLLEKSANGGSASAARILAGVLAAGYDGAPDDARAAGLLVAAARSGDAEAMRDAAGALFLCAVDDADAAALVAGAAFKDPVAAAVLVRRAAEGRPGSDARAAAGHLERLRAINYPGTERLEAALARAAPAGPPPSAAPPDWARVLRALAVAEPFRFERETLSAAPRAFVVRRAAPPELLEHAMAVAARRLAPSMTFDPVTGKSRRDDYRTSMTATLGPADNDFALARLNRRLAAIAGLSVECGEFLSVLKYAPGEEYRPHFDWIPETGRDFAASGQRVMTALLYLNEDYEGGETHLMAPDIRFRGDPGDVLVFSNVTPDGGPDQASRHASVPVRAGTKWIASKWFRARAHDF